MGQTSFAEAEYAANERRTRRGLARPGWTRPHLPLGTDLPETPPTSGESTGRASR